MVFIHLCKLATCTNGVMVPCSQLRIPKVYMFMYRVRYSLIMCVFHNFAQVCLIAWLTILPSGLQYGATGFLRACQNGNLDNVRYLCQQGVNTQATDNVSQGLSIFHYWSCAFNKYFVRMIIHTHMYSLICPHFPLNFFSLMWGGAYTRTFNQSWFNARSVTFMTTLLQLSVRTATSMVMYRRKFAQSVGRLPKKQWQ